MGILGHHLSPGVVSKARFGEPVGGVDCALTDAGRSDPLMVGVPDRFRALVGHKEAVGGETRPSTFVVDVQSLR